MKITDKICCVPFFLLLHTTIVYGSIQGSGEGLVAQSQSRSEVTKVTNLKLSDDDIFPHEVRDEVSDEVSDGYEEEEEGRACLNLDTPPETKYFYLNSNAQRIRILTSENPTQRLVSEVFKIFGSEVLGYSLSLTFNRNHSTILDPDTQFSKISSCQHQFCKDLDSNNGDYSVPSEMLTLGVMLPPTYHVDTWNLVDVGQLGPAVSLGWFIPSEIAERNDQVWDHWRTFTSRSNTARLELSSNLIAYIESNLQDEHNRYYCSNYECRGGLGTTKLCSDLRQQCALLITDYPVESSLFNTSTILKQITDSGMYVLMVFVGPNLEKVLDHLQGHAQAGSYLLLSSHPSTYTTRHRYTQIKFPTCKDPLQMRENEDIACIYSPHRLSKVVWKNVESGAPSLFSFIENLSFTYSEYISLLRMYNKMKIENPGTPIRDIACKWLLHDTKRTEKGREIISPWFQKYSSKIDNKGILYIGGIFPISGKRYQAPELAPVALMAIEHINANSTILPKYNLSLDILDGQCEADVVMKKFIDVVKTKNVERFRSTAGVLGPACSDTVEPLAGVAKHFRTVVITYSAEGSISNDNSKDYPFFFRTIAENKMYKHAFIETLNKLSWTRIAALTQEGQKYSDHISHMQDEFQKSGISFIVNRKFPKDTIHLGMYLKDLKDRRAKIIIGDFYEEAARLVMCEAYKQGMTQIDGGYVWFLPGWFKENWFDIDELRRKVQSTDRSGNISRTFNNSDPERLTSSQNQGDEFYNIPMELDDGFVTGHLPDCTTEQMKRALDGHLSLVHAHYAPDTQLMQTNDTVLEWKEKLDRRLSFSRTKFAQSRNRAAADQAGGANDQLPRRINFITDSEPNKYSGYVYDAVWLYAIALDELIRQNKSYIQDLHSKRTVEEFVNIIKKVDFQGVTGRINFYNRNSRLSQIMTKQWHNGQNETDSPTTELIGVYEPEYSSNDEPLGEDEKGEKKRDGYVRWAPQKLIWKTPDGSQPADHSKECGVLSGFATTLDIECQLAIIVSFIIGFGFVILLIFIFFFVFKHRYEMKMRAQEERMRALGLMEPTSAFALDEWEIPRDRVVINRKLGEGAFGTVYGGECFFDEKGWVAVAVKTLKVGSTNDVKIDFLSEAEMMKRFEHRNIVKLLGVCTRNEPVYTVMEYMLYGDLKTYLLARRHLVNERNREELDEVSNRRLTSMALDIARGLAYLADLKYVHRDVACRNCLVNGSRAVKLADFGMTRAMFESDYYRFSRRGMLPVRWMSPESLADGLFTPSSDIWSFGVLLYEIITFGSFPFQGLSNNQVLEQVKSGITLTVPSGIKTQLENLLKLCWRIEPTKRPTAAEIVELLGNTPRLVSPCIDVPLASVAIERTDSLELLPSTRTAGSSNQQKKSNGINVRKGKDQPVGMNQLINNLNASNQLQGNGQLTTQFSNHLNTPGHSTPTPEDAGYGSGAYSPMHASAHASQYSPMHAPRPPPYLANGRLAESLGVREPLLREQDQPSSYVPPGYIFVDNRQDALASI